MLMHSVVLEHWKEMRSDLLQSSSYCAIFLQWQFLSVTSVIDTDLVLCTVENFCFPEPTGHHSASVTVSAIKFARTQIYLLYLLTDKWLIFLVMCFSCCVNSSRRKFLTYDNRAHQCSQYVFLCLLDCTCCVVLSYYLLSNYCVIICSVLLFIMSSCRLHRHTEHQVSCAVIVMLYWSQLMWSFGLTRFVIL